METKIIEEKENPVFNRKEVVLEVVSEISPSNNEISKLIAEKFSSSEDKIKIKGIYGNFGTQIFTVYASVYKTVEDKDKTEIKTKKERDAEKKAEEERIKVEAEAKKKAVEEAAKAKEVKEEDKTE